MSRGRFYYRVEADEAEFIRKSSAPLPFAAAVVSDRYLAEHPDEDDKTRARDDLVRAREAHAAPWSTDPDTARLEHAQSANRQSARAARRPVASLQLPLSVETLRSDEAQSDLVEKAAVHQLTSRALVAPYLEVSGSDDPRAAINAALLRRTRDLAGDRVVIAYLQCLHGRVLDGRAGQVIAQLATNGADVVFVRSRRLEAEQASEADVFAYGELIAAGNRLGVRVVADSVGHLGPTLIAAGADGFASGSRFFRKVPDDLHPIGGGGGARIRWERPGGGSTTDPSAYGRRCAVSGCPAPTGAGDGASIRRHNLHEFQRAAAQAGNEGFAYAARLASNASPVVRGWGRALQRLERRAA